MRQRTFSVILIALFALGLSGCMDGPFYAMKKINPFYRKEWKKDQELGPTYTQRIEELELLEAQLADYSPDDQNRWAMQLEEIILNDPSPELRARAVQALATLQSDTVTRTLNRASSDKVEKVRMAACKAWGVQKTKPGQEMLLSLASSDASNSVRSSAIRSLGNFEDPEVRNALSGMIDDRSPAIQYEVAQSLAKITGRNYGGDFASWKKYLKGEDVPEPTPPSMTARAIDYVNPWK